MLKILWIIGMIITILRLFFFFTEDQDFKEDKAAKQFLMMLVAFALLLDVNPFRKNIIVVALAILISLLALKVNYNLYVRERERLLQSKEENTKEPPS
ncbi:MAG: hypothetical protein J6I85_04310 [Clostridia bacterium]|nr:hypothetical protein [Clostridia bacterium]